MLEQPPSAAADDESSESRAPTGILIRPREQFRYALVLVAGGIIAQSLVILTMAYYLNTAVAQVIETHEINPEVGQSISHTISLSMTVLMIIAVAFAMGATWIGIKLSHRMYGPMVPFNRHIDKLKQGYYNHRMNLRKTDELKELRDALNSLAESLQARHGSR